MDVFEAADAYVDHLLLDMPSIVKGALAGDINALNTMLTQSFYDGVHYGRTGKGPGE